MKPTIKELENRIKQLESDSYLKLDIKTIGRVFSLIFSLGISIANFYLLIYTWKLLTLGNLEKEYIKGLYQLLVLYPIIGEYIFIGLSFICLVAVIKGGFNKIKIYDEGGLIFGLIFGLIAGLIVGLIGGLIFGLIGGLIGGLIFGLIFGLIVGLIFGLIVGLIEEFK